VPQPAETATSTHVKLPSISLHSPRPLHFPSVPQAAEASVPVEDDDEDDDETEDEDDDEVSPSAWEARGMYVSRSASTSAQPTTLALRSILIGGGVSTERL